MLSRRLFASMAILALVVASALAQEATPARFRLTNQSKRVIRAVYASATSEADWGEDLLKGTPLGPGQTVALRFLGSCKSHDVRLVADAGAEYLEENVRFCFGDGSMLGLTVKDREIQKSKIAGGQ